MVNISKNTVNKWKRERERDNKCYLYGSSLSRDFFKKSFGKHGIFIIAKKKKKKKKMATFAIVMIFFKMQILGKK